MIETGTETGTSPQYLRIALDIASRIAGGEMPEGRKVSGRSLLASEYGVSPETIRRALRLLADMKVVDIRDKSGVYILSADSARRYLKGFAGWNQQKELRQRLKELLVEYHNVNCQLLEIYTEILKAQEIPAPAEKLLPNYEVKVSAESRQIGKNIGSMKFWQATGATIVAIKRTQNVIVSPGPYAELYSGDVVVFVGEPATVKTVDYYINGAAGEGARTEKEVIGDTI